MPLYDASRASLRTFVQRVIATRFASLMALLAFQQRYEKSAAPFRWTFTRDDLASLMQRLKTCALAAAA